MGFTFEFYVFLPLLFLFGSASFYLTSFLTQNKEKTGPEAGQYFHVRPPIGFI